MKSVIHYNNFFTNNKSYNNTKYPDFFKETYWGRGPSDPFSINEIVINRNNIVEIYGIKKVLHSYPSYIKKEFESLGQYADHIECYLTNDKTYILISSIYMSHDSHNNDEFFSIKEWSITDKLYSLSSTTYMKVVEMKKRK